MSLASTFYSNLTYKSVQLLGYSPLELLCDATVSVVSDHHKTKPYGIGGGQSGVSGKNTFISKGEVKYLSSKFTLACKSSDKIRIETPGGGGFGL